mmetsp:Transcript_20348/g.42667  ORF Transcript_20348/g.42667 Transcript_20348/m.42667 type:complete len:89 (-) Transcript_20348:420-686(-)
MYARMQCAIQRRMPASRLLDVRRREFRMICKTATMRDPKQIEPREYVVDRKKESLTAEEQNDEASDGENHQVPTTPATVVRTTFLMTS